MARTIGKRNKNLVRKLVMAELNAGRTGLLEIEDRVMSTLPATVLDTWESAHDEIIRIIGDIVMAHNYSKKAWPV